MREILCLIFFLLHVNFIFPHLVLTELSDFVLYGEHDLYSKPEAAKSAFVFRLLNHEGGLKFRVLKNGKKENGGQWHYIILNNGQWNEDGKWFAPNTKFWIFVEGEEERFID